MIDRTGAQLLISGLGGQVETPTLDLLALPLDTGRAYRGPRPSGEDIAEIVFTSGTTGRPKGVVLTHANVVANVRSARAALQPTRDFRLLSVLPLSHMFEQTAGLFLPLHVGASIHYATSRQSPVILKTMRRHRVTAMAVVPQVLELLLVGIEREVDRRGTRGSGRPRTGSPSICRPRHAGCCSVPCTGSSAATSSCSSAVAPHSTPRSRRTGSEWA